MTSEIVPWTWANHWKHNFVLKCYNKSCWNDWLFKSKLLIFFLYQFQSMHLMMKWNEQKGNSMYFHRPPNVGIWELWWSITWRKIRSQHREHEFINLGTTNKLLKLLGPFFTNNPPWYFFFWTLSLWFPFSWTCSRILELFFLRVMLQKKLNRHQVMNN